MSQPEKQNDAIYEVGEGQVLTPFEMFRQYSAEEKDLIKKMGFILFQGYPDAERVVTLEILDVGAGEGRHQAKFARHLKKLNEFREFPLPIHFTWLEKNTEYVRGLEDVATRLHEPFSAIVAPNSWETFVPDRKFDIVILSHVIYEFPAEQFDELLKKFYSWVKPGGRLVVIAREKDEDYQFLQEFYEPVTKRPFHERTIDDAEDAFKRLGIASKKRHAYSHISIPVRTNKSDAHRVIEFYFRGKPWDTIDIKEQQDIETYLLDEERDGKLEQEDGILVVRKPLEG